jgi:hypothetical protein
VSRRGFTLFEILLAIGLTAALLGSMFTFLRDMTDARARAAEHMRRQRTAQVLFERLERDLACCLVGDARDGAGLAGEPHRLSLLTRAVPGRLAERGSADPLVLADLERCDYVFSGDAASIAMRRQVVGFAQAPEEAMADIGPASLMQFRFHDGGRWTDRFDSLRAGRLPRAVEVAIWFDPPGGEPAEPAAGTAPDAEPWPAEEEAASGADEADAAAPSGFDRPLREDRGRRAPDRLRLMIIPDGGGGDDA